MEIKISLDLNMPKMNGLEFLKELRGDPDLKSCITYVMTTSQEEKDIVSAYKHFIAGYIVKPLDFNKFLEAIRTLNMGWNLFELPKKTSL